MQISDEAVEAGARAVYAHLRLECPKPWDELKPIWRANYRKEARAVLAAAAPHMLAEAWDEGNIAGMFDLPSENHATNNPYRSRS